MQILLQHVRIYKICVIAHVSIYTIAKHPSENRNKVKQREKMLNYFSIVIKL